MLKAPRSMHQKLSMVVGDTYEAAMQQSCATFMDTLSHNLQSLVACDQQVWGTGLVSKEVERAHLYEYDGVKHELNSLAFLNCICQLVNTPITLLEHTQWSQIVLQFPQFSAFSPAVVICPENALDCQTIVLLRSRTFTEEEVELVSFFEPHIGGAIETNLKQFIQSGWKQTKNERAVFTMSNKLVAKTKLYDELRDKALIPHEHNPDISKWLSRQQDACIDKKFRIKVTYLSSYKVLDIVECDRGIERLSSAERDVCKLIAVARTNKEIMQHLDISIKTVEAHLSSIMDKLRVSNRAEVISYLHDSGYDLNTL